MTILEFNKSDNDIIRGTNITIHKGDSPHYYKRDVKNHEEKQRIESNRKTVFIIHGHNEAKWRELENILRGLELYTIELSQQVDDGGTIIEKFEKYASQCCFAFALFSYDDVVAKNTESYLQVRPNVIFELGWFYAKIGRKNVMILEQETSNSNIFSDLQGIIRTKYRNDVEEVYKKIVDQLKRAEIIT
ncbi:MAG: nucleotide-binding protein [Lachnospiraceae bacterium]